MTTFSTDDDDYEAAADKSPRQTLDRLRDRLSEQEAQSAELFASIRDDITQLAHQLKQAERDVAPQQVAVEAPVRQPPPLPVGRPVGMVPNVSPVEFLVSGADADASADLELLTFGPELSANGSLADEREDLLTDAMNGEPAALSLCGAIMLFRGATGERLPLLLKDIGEAWYGWRPTTADGPDDLRDELCGWLQRKCAEAGVPNVIELVRPGDRFDSKRHHARQPGVEVVDVGGWVVLRDNGKVYTKAAVTVR
ncbi:MAG: hypothetical protein K8T25_06965 [Planctomycetia bacterium]|nr:hypothetical protein [Planctomycetia bacterium]